MCSILLKSASADRSFSQRIYCVFIMTAHEADLILVLSSTHSSGHLASFFPCIFRSSFLQRDMGFPPKRERRTRLVTCVSFLNGLWSRPISRSSIHDYTSSCRVHATYLYVFEKLHAGLKLCCTCSHNTFVELHFSRYDIFGLRSRSNCARWDCLAGLLAGQT